MKNKAWIPSLEYLQSLQKSLSNDRILSQKEKEEIYKIECEAAYQLDDLDSMKESKFKRM